MLTDEEISGYAGYVEELRLLIHELPIPANNRVRASAACFAIAQEHHHAIVTLVESRLYAAAFSLLRCEFEAYVRGEWLAQCASDGLIEAFIRGKEPPKIGCMLEQLEMLETFNEKVLSRIKQKSWNAMCAYTHTGGLHVQRWNSADGIEANYAIDEILEVLSFAEIIASIAIVGVAGLAANDELALRALNSLKRRTQG